MVARQKGKVNETPEQWRERHKDNPRLQYYLRMDPNYGAHRHQREFVDRQWWLQANFPCPVNHEVHPGAPCAGNRDHATDDAKRHPGGLHAPCCYSGAALQAAYEWQLASRGRP